MKYAMLLGMPRGATTFLYHKFNLPPELSVPYRRKTNFFSLHYQKGLSWYQSQLNCNNKLSTKYIIDTETLMYLNCNLEVLDRISEFGDINKVLIVFRRPSDWAVSMFNQIKKFDKKMRFEEFLSGNAKLIEDGKSINLSIEDGGFKNIIEGAIDLFKDKLLVVDYERFSSNPINALKEIEEFLEVDSFFTEASVNQRKINAGHSILDLYGAKIMRHVWTIKIMSVLPRSLVIFLRRLYDLVNIEIPPHKNDLVDIGLARRRFQKDDKFYESFFKAK